MSTANCKSCNWDEGWPICLRDERCPFSPAPKPTESKHMTPTPQPAAEPWMSSYSVRLGRDRADCVDLIFTTIAAREFQLYRYEAEYLRDLLNAALAASTPPHPQALPELPAAWQERQQTSNGYGHPVGWTDWYSCGQRAVDDPRSVVISGIGYEWRPLYASAALAQPPAEPARPDIIERLTYHALERDDLTLDDALQYLGAGWKAVHGRTERQLVLQIVSLLAGAPAAEPVQAVPGWRLVPIEPTDEMLVAGGQAQQNSVGSWGEPSVVWRAMVESATQPPSPQPERAKENDE